MAFVDWFRLRRWEYFADFFLTPPITIVIAAVSLANGPTLLWAVEFLVGLLWWTLYEYVAHRWILHRVWLFRDMHALHHVDQKDYIALHPLGTLALYGFLWLLFGLQSSALMVGFSIGYTIYSAAHTAFHYANIPAGHVLFAAKRRHALHHTFETTNYGVTTPLWDIIFRTYRK